MKDLFERADEIPVTLLTLLAFVTMAFLTDPFHPSAAQLDRYGWMTPLMVSSGEPWRLVTYAFLHGGIVHLGVNTMSLLAIGPALERALGSLRMAILYGIAAIGGGLAVCLCQDPRGPVVGGSGALFGMLGAIVALQMRAGRHAFEFLDYEGPRRVLGLIAANLLIGLWIPFISNTAHVGGLLAGFAVTFLWLVPPRTATPGLGAWRAASVALFAGLTFGAVCPATRFDWLWDHANAADDPARRDALQRAAAASFYGLERADDDDVMRFYTEVLVPKPK